VIGEPFKPEPLSQEETEARIIQAIKGLK